MAWFGTHSYRKKITIDSTKVAGTETDFTVPYYVTDTDIRDNIGQADGGDIVFTASDGSTQLSHELAEYDSGTGLIEAYIKIPTLSSVADTDLYIYYGDAGIADQEDPTNAWDSNYVIVNHGRIPTIGTFNTLTSPQASAFNNITQGSNEVAGQIGNSVLLNGTDEYISMADDAETQITPDITYEFISRRNGIPGVVEAIGGKYKPSVPRSGCVALGFSGTGIHYFLGAEGGDVKIANDGTNICDNTWHYTATMHENNNFSLATGDQSDHVDHAATTGGSIDAVGFDMEFGHGSGFAGTYWEGNISEIRVSDTVRSLTWRQTTYESLINYASFSSTDVEEVGVVPPGDTWYPHHPFPVPLGDRCTNTRYTDGGDIWWNVVDDFDQDTSWDIVNEWDVDTSWDTVNDFDQDIAWDIQNEWLTTTSWDLLNDFSSGTSWDVLNDFDQDTSWDILNEWLQTTSWDSIKCFDNGTSWHIYPSQIEYIQKSGVHSVRFHFEVKRIATNFEAKDIDTNFEVAAVIDDNISVKPTGGLMEFNLKPVQYNFTVKYDLVHTFKITRVLDSSRDMR